MMALNRIAFMATRARAPSARCVSFPAAVRGITTTPRLWSQQKDQLKETTQELSKCLEEELRWEQDAWKEDGNTGTGLPAELKEMLDSLKFKVGDAQ